MEDSDIDGEAYTEISMDKSGKPIIFPGVMKKRAPVPVPVIHSRE